MNLEIIITCNCFIQEWVDNEETLGVKRSREVGINKKWYDNKSKQTEITRLHTVITKANSKII